MNDSSRGLYFFGGITGILGGLVMLYTSYSFIFQDSDRPDIMHGVSVGLILLIIPTLVATSFLLFKEAKGGTLLGIAFAIIWVLLELVAHCTQTTPLKIVMGQAASQQEFGKIFKDVWEELRMTLTLTSAFSYSLMAICFGLSLRSWGNSGSAYILIISAVAFAATFIPNVHLYWHIAIRGLAFIFLGGVLLQARREGDDVEWGEES